MNEVPVIFDTAASPPSFPMMFFAGCMLATNFRFSEIKVKSYFGFSKLIVFLIHRKMANMDHKLISRTLDARGLSKSGLAQVLKIPNSAVTALLKGDRRLLADEVPKVRKYLKLDTVPIVGRVAAGAKMIFLPDTGEWERVPAPDDANENTVAAEIHGTSLGPLFDHWLVFYDQVERPVTKALFKKLCVVGTTDGQTLVKMIEPSKTRGLFHLYSNTEAPLLDVQIEWAARVKTMVPR